jgi:palmitoyltransferase
VIGWPPPDPDRIPRIQRKYGLEEDSAENAAFQTATDVAAFRERQQQDYARWDKSNSDMLRRRQPFHKRYDDQAITENDPSSPDLYTEEVDEGEESWRDHEGQRLKDFGLDEEAEFYDQDDDVPLAELVRRRRTGNST